MSPVPLDAANPLAFVRAAKQAREAVPNSCAERVAPGFSQSVTLVIEGRGCTERNDCVGTAFGRRVRAGSVVVLRDSSCPAIALPPFKI